MGRPTNLSALRKYFYRSLPLLFLIFAALASNLTWAYPIYLKCNSKGELTDVIEPQELRHHLELLTQGMNTSQLKLLTSSACKDLRQCLNELRQLTLLTSQTMPIVNSLVDPNEKERADFLIEQFEEIALCHKNRNKLDPEKFLFTYQGGDPERKKVFLYYPRANEYSKMTGQAPKVESCSDKQDGFCKQVVTWEQNWGYNDAQDMRDTIRSALISGNDPYFALSLGLMENGPNGWKQLYLDPREKPRALGFKVKDLGAATRVLKNVIAGEFSPDIQQLKPTYQSQAGKISCSYGLCYLTEPGVKKIPELIDILRKLKKLSGGTHQLNTSKSPRVVRYYCTPTSKLDEWQFYEYSTQCGMCACMDLGQNYKSTEVKNFPMAELMLFSRIRQIQNKDLNALPARPESDDLPMLAQGFNGYDDFMGEHERVTVFRAGINQLKDPDYGQQAMDFILNSLVSNAWIRSEVSKIKHELEKKLGQELIQPNLICRDAPSQTLFSIDSNSYFNKHRTARRFDEIASKTELGQLPPGQQKVMLEELKDESVMSKLKDLNIPLTNNDITAYAISNKLKRPNQDETKITITPKSNEKVKTAFHAYFNKKHPETGVTIYESRDTIEKASRFYSRWNPEFPITDEEVLSIRKNLLKNPNSHSN